MKVYILRPKNEEQVFDIKSFAKYKVLLSENDAKKYADHIGASYIELFTDLSLEQIKQGKQYTCTTHDGTIINFYSVDTEFLRTQLENDREVLLTLIREQTPPEEINSDVILASIGRAYLRHYRSEGIIDLAAHEGLDIAVNSGSSAKNSFQRKPA